jgi:hypothetical protein
MPEVLSVVAVPADSAARGMVSRIEIKTWPSIISATITTSVHTAALVEEAAAVGVADWAGAEEDGVAGAGAEDGGVILT